MAEPIVKYRLFMEPQGSTDGSTIVYHQLRVIVSEDDGETWAEVPEHQKTFCVPSGELEIVLDKPHNTGALRRVKNLAYKTALQNNRTTFPVAYVMPGTSDWSEAGILAYRVDRAAALAAKGAINTAAALQAARAVTYIVDTLGQTFPEVDFALS